MPQVSSLFTISGNAGGLCFFKVNDKTFVRKPTSLEGDRWWHKPTMHRAQERALEFGGSSQAAANIRQQIPATLHPLMHRYSHNQLAMAIRQTCTTLRKQQGNAYSAHPNARCLNSFSAEGIARAVPAIQLGKAQGPQSTFSLSPDCYPGSLSHSLSITGLHEFAQSQGMPTGNTHREFRIHIAYARASELHRPAHAARRRADFTRIDGSTDAQLIPAHSTGWAPVLAIDPANDVLQLPELHIPDEAFTHALPGDHILVFLGIEWRDRTGARFKRLHHMSSFQGITAIPISNPGQPIQKRTYIPKRLHAAPRPPVRLPLHGLKRLNPEERRARMLAQALAALRPPA